MRKLQTENLIEIFKQKITRNYKYLKLFKKKIILQNRNNIKVLASIFIK
jgi:hypothetical protein